MHDPSTGIGALETIFYGESHNVCQKWQHYFDIYEKHFARYRDRPLRFLEIGVSQGGSLDLWRRYFGSRAALIGVDIDPACRRFERDQVQIIIGDQGDEAFLAHLRHTIGEVDVILDDGGHTMEQQIRTFRALYPVVREGGIYMCEDVHTSYSAAHGGGLGRPGTFIEHVKACVDDLHSWYHGPVAADSIARSTHCISFYDSIVAFDKRRFDGPRYVEVGHSAMR